jgi:hypothetical protein
MAAWVSALVWSVRSGRRSSTAGSCGAFQRFLAHQASQADTAARLRFQVAGAEAPQVVVNISARSSPVSWASARSGPRSERRRSSAVVREVFALDRDGLAPDTLGLRLAEAKDLLAAVQDTLVSHQVSTAIAAQVACPDCGQSHRHKDSRDIVMTTLFGRLRLTSPRWWHCGCRPHDSATFSPLAALLPERTTPELAYLQARFAGLVSYGLSASLLSEILPLGHRLHATTLRRHTQAVAQRLEDELGDEQPSFIDTCQLDREELPRPDLPLTVSLDGGYVHSAAQRSRRDGWFEASPGGSSRPKGPPSASATCRPTTPSPNGGSTRYSRPRA